MNLRHSRSLGSTRSFQLPLFIYVQDPLYRLFLGPRFGHILMLAHPCVAPLPLPLPHTIYNSFFLIHGRHSPSSRASPPYLWRTQVHLVVTLRSRTNPPSCARAFYSPIAVVLNHFIYSLRKAPYTLLSRVNCPCPHVSLLSSYPPLLLVLSLLSREGERGGRGRRVLLMYGLEIALAKPINRCSYLAWRGCLLCSSGQ